MHALNLEQAVGSALLSDTRCPERIGAGKYRFARLSGSIWGFIQRVTVAGLTVAVCHKE